MSANSPLLIDLAGVARLADVQRPVASVWRKRFASASDPFPPVHTEKGGRPLFNVMSIAQWLERTEHGNNPDAVADAAASAAPDGFDISDASHVAAVDALLVLRAASGEPVGGLSLAELQRRAVTADPDDSCLLSEISTAHEVWAEWADLLSDAAYSPVQASRLLERRHAATTSFAGSSGPLTTEADALLAALTDALIVDRQADLILSAGIGPSLASQLFEQVSDGVDVAVSGLPAGRSIRRRLLCDGLPIPTTQAPADTPLLHIMRLPSSTTRAASVMLQTIDELVLEMRDHDRAIVLAPASVLVDSNPTSEGLGRTDVLRSGRVRAMVKLPVGLVSAAPREALALWVLGRETGDVPMADRFTAVADLTDTALTSAARADLTSDVVAAMGSARDVRAHAFRFTRLVRTTALLAARGALISGRHAPVAPSLPTKDLPALLDQALAELREDAPLMPPAAGPGPTVSSAQVEELIAQRHLRLLSGTRMAPDEFSKSGLVVVGAADLDDPATIGGRRVEPLVFAARHPSARLTMAGDVVFRTAPTAKAWVDADGSKIVAHPARVLRIDRADPGGLVPELVAADIDHARGGPAAWRRWRLRRVLPTVAEPLRATLIDLGSRRESLAQRMRALDTYAEVLTSAVVSGAVTLTDNAADAASDLH